MSHFIKIRPVEAELFRADGRKDGQTAGAVKSGDHEGHETSTDLKTRRPGNDLQQIGVLT